MALEWLLTSQIVRERPTPIIIRQPRQKPEKIPREGTDTGIMIFFFVAFIVHIIDVFIRLSGSGFGYYHNIFWLYFMLGIWAALGPLKDETKNAFYNILFYFSLTLIAYFAPIINLLIRDLGFTETIGQNILEGFVLFAPLWLIYLMYVHGSPFTQKIGLIYGIFWLFLLVFNYSQQAEQAYQDVEINGFNAARLISYITEQFWNGTKFVATSVLGVVKSIPEGISKWWEGTICYATGRDDCQGRVDPTKDFIGVYLQDIDSATSFYENRPVRLPFLIKARALSSDIKIDVSCKATNPGGDVDGIIKPKSRFSIETTDILEEQVDCEIYPEDPNQALDTGSHEAKISAEFNFQTQARLVQYFIDEARLKALRVKKQDPLIVYKEFIQEPSPIAVYSNGPIKVGMGLGKLQPISINTQDESFPGTITINIFNNWRGKVKEFKNVYIIIPKGFDVKEINSEELNNDWKVLCEGEIKLLGLCNDVEQVIKIPKKYINEITRAGSASLFIDFEITKDNYLLILEQGIPVSTKYFKVFVDYDYILEHKRAFNIIKLPGE